MEGEIKVEPIEVETTDQIASASGDKTDNTGEEKKYEVSLLFFGTFDHDTSEVPNVDLIQFKEYIRITEVRVIPLGAEVILPNGSCQLGATIPASVTLEFFYNDLQNSGRSTFAMLDTFPYNDKVSIQLDCNTRDPQVITDALVVRGEYSTVTLALYGYPVGEGVIKPSELSPENEEEVVGITVESLTSKTSGGDEDFDKFPSSEYMIKEEDHGLTIKQESTTEALSPPPIMKPVEPKPPPLSIEVPQAIPTISTRVNFSPTKPPVQQQTQQDLKLEDLAGKVEIVSSDEEQFEDTVEEVAMASKAKPDPGVLLMDTEDISDGEISDPPEDDLDKAGCKRSPGRGTTIKDDVSSTLVAEKIVQPESPHELLSDQDDSFGDVEEFPDPAVEEIISDDDMPDYGEEEYGEWDDSWSQKFNRNFNPFLGTYEVQELRNIKIEAYLRKCGSEDQFAASRMLGAISNFSECDFVSAADSFVESWVEKMEQILPILPQALNAIGEEDQEILKATRFWMKRGLDLEYAKNQASILYKIRHIKAGLKLVHVIFNYGGLIAEEMLKLNFDGKTTLQHKLLDMLMDNDLKAIVSIQTLILKGLDATLSTRYGFRMFSSRSDDNKNPSGFQRLITYFLDSSSTTRTSFAFRTLLNKVTLTSSIFGLEETILLLLEDESDGTRSPRTATLILGREIVAQSSAILLQLIGTARRIGQTLAFPIRNLPADTVVELSPSSSGHDPKLNFIRLLRETRFMKTLAVLLTSKEAHELFTPVTGLIHSLLGWEEGLVYLCSEAEFTTIVVKALLQCNENKRAALEFSHSLEVIRCIDLLQHEMERSGINEQDEDVQSLQQLYSFLATPIGRESLLKTLSVGKVIKPLIQCLREAGPKQTSNTDKLTRLVHSTRNGYAMDIIIFLIKFSPSAEFLEEHGNEIHDLILSLGDHYEGSDKLNEVLPFLKPSVDNVHFSYDGIESLCSIIKEKMPDFLQTSNAPPEQNWGFNPEIVTALRILSSLAIAPEEEDVTAVLQGTDDIQTSKQLKFMISFVKMNNEDLLTDLTTMLHRVSNHFEQGVLQTYLLVGSKGDGLLALLHPLISLFRKILTRIIQVRNSEFRDLTHVPTLLQIYSLMSSFPISSLSHCKSEEIGVNIINTLLAYTIPAMKRGEESEEELTKSVWTAMINEIIKFIWTSPANFVPGLTAISELLPFPFPIQTSTKLTPEESGEWVRQKRLWSAYLVGAASQLQEVIGILCESAHPELLNILKQVCLKLADLSASTCLVICRSVMHQVLASIEIDFETTTARPPCESPVVTSFVKAWVETSTEKRTLYCSLRTTRLLDFLASLITSHGIFKAGVMNVCRALAKTDEKFVDFISMLCSILTSWPTKNLAPHAQGQRIVVTIFQALCDIEFNIFSTGGDLGQLEERTPNSEYIRQNCLLPKEMLAPICSAFINYLNSFDLNTIALKACIAENVLHALQIISETEYGFHHLRMCLDKNTNALNSFTKKLARPLQDENIITPMVEIVTAYMNFLNCLITPKEDTENSLTIRQITLTDQELRKFVNWTPGPNLTEVIAKVEPYEGNKDVEQMDMDHSPIVEKKSPHQDHPLLLLRAELEKWISRIDDNQETYQIYLTLESSLEILNKLLDVVAQTEKTTLSPQTEIVLTNVATLTELFTNRPVFVLLEENTLISPSYITSYPISFYEELEQCQENELAKCDLIELAKTEISGLDLAKEIEIFFKKSIPSNLREMRNKDNQLETADVKLIPRMGMDNSSTDGGFNSGLLALSARKPIFPMGMRGNSNRIGFGRGPGPHGFDPFRSRPPNTSRPPSLHVDDFVALESSGQGGGGGGGQSNFNKSGPRPGAGRGQRGTNRPFNNNERGRPFRSPQASYYQRNDGNNMNSARGRGGRGRGMGGGNPNGSNNQRWGNSDTAHSQHQNFGSARSDNRATEDKFRGGSSRPLRSGMGARQQFSRNPYNRESPGRSSGIGGNANANSSASRWRDRQRPYNWASGAK